MYQNGFFCKLIFESLPNEYAIFSSKNNLCKQMDQNNGMVLKRFYVQNLTG